jgi:hypothetical protein
VLAAACRVGGRLSSCFCLPMALLALATATVAFGNGRLSGGLRRSTAAAFGNGGFSGGLRHATASRRSAQPLACVPAPWIEYLDEDSGNTFFHNPDTGESLWELPAAPAPEPPPPPPPPLPLPAPPPQSPPANAELQARLLTLVRRLPGRGRDASEAEKPPWEVQAVLTAIDELEPLDPAARDGWMYSNEFDNAESAAPWVLRFTNSRTFHRNDGLTGYAYKRPDCTTPEVLLRVNSPRRGFCIVEEPSARTAVEESARCAQGCRQARRVRSSALCLSPYAPLTAVRRAVLAVVRPGAASASPGDSVEAECAWSVGPKDALKLEPQQMRADGREWATRARAPPALVPPALAPATRATRTCALPPALQRAAVICSRCCFAVAPWAATDATRSNAAALRRRSERGRRGGHGRRQGHPCARGDTCGWHASKRHGSPLVGAPRRSARRSRIAPRLCVPGPVYLDGGLLVLRSAVLDEIVFVWTRNGADDPPPVDVTPPDEGEAGLPASIAAVLAARDATKTKRPANREIINRYN